VIALENKSDNKAYEVRFSPDQFHERIEIGSEVAIIARFDGYRYVARSLKLHAPRPVDADVAEEERRDTESER
jgi:hypothetical protein